MDKYINKLNFIDQIFTEKLTVCLDVGSYALKAVEIERTNGGLSLRKFAYKEIPVPFDGSEKEGNAWEKEMVRIISELWNEQKFSTKKIKLILSDRAIYSRQITIPYASEDELESGMKWQAEKYISSPIDDSIVDFQFLSPEINHDKNSMGVVFVCAGKNTINRYLSVLKEAGLSATHIDVSFFGMAKSSLRYRQIQPDEILAVVDLGHFKSSLVLLNKKDMLLVRTFEPGGIHLTESIAKGLNIDNAKAEVLKRNFCIPGSQNQNEDNKKIMIPLEPVLAEIVQQINRSLAYCERELVSYKIKKLLLCGGGAMLGGIDVFLAEKLGLGVERFNSPEDIAVRCSRNIMSDPAGLLPFVVTALGGAL